VTDQRGSSQSANPSAGTPAIVDVFAEPDGVGGIAFSHEWRWNNGQSQGKGTIDVPKRSASESGTPIHFNLRDNTGRDLRFADDSKGPIWVTRGACPSSQSSDPEIPEDKIQGAPNLLKLFNENNEECTLHYALRFTDKGGTQHSYDPDIKNGGKV